MLWLDAKRCESCAEPEAGKWTASWRGYVCMLRPGSALLRVAEQLAEGRTKKPRLFSQGFASRANALGNNSERVEGTKDGAEAVPGLTLAACGAML